MRRAFFCFCIIAGSIAAVFGNKNADSLLKVAVSGSLKERFSAFNTLSEQNQNTDPVKSLAYAEQARNIARKLKSRVLEAEAMNSMAIILIMENENKKAIRLLNDCFTIYDSLGDEKGKSRTNNNLGIAYSGYGSYEKALENYLSVVTYYEKKRDIINLTNVYMNIGLVYENLNKANLAIEYSTKAEELAHQTNDAKKVADIMVNKGMTYVSMGNYGDAESNFRKALDYYKSKEMTYDIALVSYNFGHLYKVKRDFKQALCWYNIALPLSHKIGNSWAEASIWNELAGISFQQGSWNGALQQLDRANRLNEINPDPGLQEQIYLLYANIYDTLRQPVQELAWYKKYSALHDSLNSLEKTKSAEVLNIQYETSKKSAENDLLKKNIQIHRFQLVIVTSALLICILVIIFLLFIHRINRKRHLLEKTNAEQEAKATREELSILHNELTSKAMQLASNAEKKGDYIDKLRSLISYLTEEGKYILQKLVSDLSNESHENLWKEFERYFIKMHPGFLNNLTRQFPALTPNDRKICAMIRSNLSTKEIALVLNRSVRTIESAKYHLKKKMNLENDQDLTSFLTSL